MMRIGLLGASRIAPNAVILPSAKREDVTVVAVAARDGERARRYADAHGIPHALEGYDALLAREDIDVVYCGLPPSEHLRTCLAALAAGQMLLVEKPFAMDAESARRIVAAASGRTAIEAFHYRFHGQFIRAVELVRSGSIGQVVRMEGVFNAQIKPNPAEYRWRADCGGGATMDLGCYVIHAFRTLLGCEPTVLSADAVFAEGVDVSLRAELSFEGVPAVMACSMAAPREDHIIIKGTKAFLRLDSFVSPQRGGRLRLRRGDEEQVELASGPASYEAQLDHVAQVWRGSAAPLTGGPDAIANMTVIDACLDLARRSPPYAST